MSTVQSSPHLLSTAATMVACDSGLYPLPADLNGASFKSYVAWLTGCFQTVFPARFEGDSKLVMFGQFSGHYNMSFCRARFCLDTESLLVKLVPSGCRV